MSVEALIDRLSERMSDDIVPMVITEMSDEERARIREAVVQATIDRIKAGETSSLRALADRSTNEVWDMLRKHPAVVAAITAAAEDLSGACVEAITKAKERVRTGLADRFSKLLRDGY
jgi:uncharacterized membrane-anchored protein YjiN (DUF445 family)